MCEESVPVLVIGDFNASLPHMDILTKYWYKCRPFNCNSAILYDFVSNNSLAVANFSFKQNVNYTFCNNAVNSYIDHILVPD